MGSSNLSLNYPKTNFMVINKYPHKSVSARFNLNLNDIALKQVKTIKYLGISIDETLTWTSHIRQLTLQLSKYAGLFYRLHNYVADETLYIRTILHLGLQQDTIRNYCLGNN